MTVDDCIASATADTRAHALARIKVARERLRDAKLAASFAEDELNRAIVAGRAAGVSVRALGSAAGMSKTRAADIARFGEAGWR